ncbi:MAG: hypothetical protein V1912_06710 [bacterium]
MGLTLISVAIGLGLAVAYAVASLRFQLLVSKRSHALVPALTAAGFVVRLTLFAVILVLLALFTDLNIVALAVAFVVLYTLLSGLGMHRYLTKAKRARTSGGTGPQGGIVGG